MAIAAVFNIPGMTQQQYDQVIKDLEAKGAGNPDGRLYHVASLSEAGGLVIDVWESEEKLGQFGEVLIPTLVAAGVTPAEAQIHPVHNIIEG